MRLRLLSALTVVVTITLAAPAAAQHREPNAGSLAAGADAGFIVGDQVFHVGFTPAAFAEFYFTSRVSGRVLGGWSRNEFVNRDNRHLEQLRAAFNVAYNWEYELWHPFVTGGISVHRVHTSMDDVEDSESISRPGFNAGLGAEYFASQKVSLKFEATYYWVSQGDLPADASGVVLSIGLKKYF
jgi:opacity protein-like surface antigen